jgi:hypothetical protein
LTRYKLMAAVAALALTASVLSAGSASANTGYEGGVINLGGTGRTSMCLDATSDATHSAVNNGDPVQLWSCSTNPAPPQQLWKFNEDPGSYGTIQNGYGGLCLDAQSDNTHSPKTNGDPVQLWTCNGGTQQQWEPRYAGTNGVTSYYAFVNKASGLVLDAREDATHSPSQDGDPMQLWSGQYTVNQFWLYP